MALADQLSEQRELLVKVCSLLESGIFISVLHSASPLCVLTTLGTPKYRRQTRIGDRNDVRYDRRNFLKASVLFPLSDLPTARALSAALSAPASTDTVPATTARTLLKPNLSHSLGTRCLTKPIFASHTIDDMESNPGWIASPVVQLTYTHDRAKSGTQSMRFSTLIRNGEFIAKTRTKEGFFTGEEVHFVGQPFSAFAMLNFEKLQDWRAFNRISLWCYLHPTTVPNNSISLQFLCEGATAGPSDPLPLHYIGDLTPGAWNHLTWEISEYPRDRIKQFILFKPTSGSAIAGSDSRITFDFDQLELQHVEVEPVSSWKVTPGKISYSHTGYHPGAPKLAYCSDFSAKTFRLLNAATGALAAELPVQSLTTPRGAYAVLDFTAHTAPGLYRLTCGPSQSEAFPIGDEFMNLLVDATLNTFFAFRCGCAASGAHDACHLDTFVQYKGQRRTMAGGWHDAANNTQFSDSTHLSVFTLLRLHEALAADPKQNARSNRALEEASWGLDWCLRMRFAPGVRMPKNFAAYWTDSKVGNADDVLQINVGRNLRENIFALVALASAARVLGKTSPTLARQALRAAEEDYASIRPEIAAPWIPTDFGDAGRGTWRDLSAYLTLCAVDLFRATGKSAYRDDALRFGSWIAALQEQRFLDGSPVTGYFYADRERTQIQRELYGSCDDSGLLALQALCDAFPDDPHWIDWYAGLLIYAEYFCQQGSHASAPFQVIPACVWRKNDLQTDIRPDLIGARYAFHASPVAPTPLTPELVAQQMRKMYDAGTELGREIRLRIFPIWFNHVQHGSTTAHLCRTAGLGSAAQVRGNLPAAQLATRQLQWITGANPFSRSLLFGIGYDYWQNFTVDNVNFVGGLGLGMNSYVNDEPAWPNNAVFPYKEQWSYSTSRMALNLAQAATPARIAGRATVPVTLHEQLTGTIIHLPAGAISDTIAPGRYTAKAAGAEWKLDLVGGRPYHLTFDPANAISIVLKATSDKAYAPSPSIETNTINLRATIRGTGAHTLTLQLFNCGTSTESSQTLILDPTHPTTLDFPLQITDPNTPWVAVLTPATNPDLRQETFGRLLTYPTLT